MGLRAKIAAIFAALLIFAVLAVSATEINHTLTVMVGDLSDSGTMLTHQAFEQIRSALQRTTGDPVVILRQDPGLAALLASSRAFGKGVVYARVETLSGDLVAGTPDDTGVSASGSHSFDELRQAATRWSPLVRIHSLWGEKVYEISTPVEINGQPFALIRVGLSTALIATEVHRAVLNVLMIAGIVIVTSLLGALLSGALLLSPVAVITAAIAQLAAGGDTGRLDVRGHDELSELAQRFNELSHRVRSDRTQWEDERGHFISIFRSIADALMLIDSEGILRFSNDEAHGVLGLPAGGLAQGKPLGALIGEDHPLLSVLRTAKETGVELRDVAIEPGQSNSGLLVSVFPLGRDPARAGRLVIVRDLDPVQELESVVNYSGRLARMSGIISGVAHQIRNPLNAITLELELLHDDALHSRPVEKRVHAVREEMHRVGEVIEALMRFMRPEKLKIEPVAANDLLDKLGGDLDDKLLEVIRQPDPANPILQADRAVLMEALRNIVQNAADAMPEGGSLWLASATSDGFVELTISDTGRGISPEHLEDIFRLHFTTRENGNGMGLPLALRAVDLHGGTIKIESAVNKGTTVRIRLPLDIRGPEQSVAEFNSSQH